MKIKNKIYFIMVLAMSLILINGQQCEQKGDLLQVKLYDVNKNPITSDSTMSIVGGVPNVQYVGVTTTITNTGNIDIEQGRMNLIVPNTIAKGFLQNYIPIGGTKSACNDIGATIQSVIGGNDIICQVSPLLQGESYTFSSGLVNVDNIGYGTYNLNVEAYGGYFEQGIEAMQFTERVSKTTTLTIAPDEVIVCPPGTAYNAVTKECDIIIICPKFMPPSCPYGYLVGQGTDASGCPLPPICKICPDGTIYNSVTQRCEPEKCMSNSDCVPSTPLKGIIYYCEIGECKTKPLLPSVNVEITT